jgi:nitrite reductase/ring-hydroxylating ferredoxin subunit
MRQDESVSGTLIRRSDLPDVGFIALDVVIAGQHEPIIVHCEQDKLTAWINACPHQGRRLDYAPGKFLLDKGQLVCAAHGATFRLADGECVAGPCRGEHLTEVPVWVGDDGIIEFGPLL